MTGSARRPLWTCPRCGKRYVTPNMWHSCVRVTVRDHLKGRPRHLVELYRAIGRMVRSCGPGVRTVSSKTKTGWMVRARFAGVEFRRDHLVLSFWLKRPIRSRRLRREHYGGRDFGYRLPVRAPDDLDDEVRAWLCEAYLVGRQAWEPAPRATMGSGRTRACQRE